MGSADPSLASRTPPEVTPFGKYLLLERIAVGGMAEVYTAKSFGIEGFEKTIAIKRILPAMAEDEDFIAMFIDEAKIAGRLTHANIAPIYELGKLGGSHYIAMEYVWGKDLLQIINRFRRMRRRMPPVMGAWIASRMLEGLDYAHRKRDADGHPMGIIHRDVSPQNILVSYEGQVKIIDFGIAKAVARHTRTQAGVLKGKFGYMSPEQVRGDPIDHRSDIFAASTCLHEMLTGERLFTGESDFSVLEKVRNARVHPPSQVREDMPAELEAILMRGLTREPDQRWPSAGEMQEALSRFIARSPLGFGTVDLNTWMRTAFAQELAKEKARLDRFADLRPPAATPPQLRRGAVVPTPPRGSGRPEAKASADAIGSSASTEGEADLDTDPEPLEGDRTLVTAAPFAEGEGEAPFVEQPTEIYFSSAEREVAMEQGAIAEPAHPPEGRPRDAPAPPPRSTERGGWRPADAGPPAARVPPPRAVGVPSPASEEAPRRLRPPVRSRGATLEGRPPPALPIRPPAAPAPPDAPPAVRSNMVRSNMVPSEMVPSDVVPSDPAPPPLPSEVPTDTTRSRPLALPSNPPGAPARYGVPWPALVIGGVLLALVTLVAVALLVAWLSSSGPS
ncbi:MAG: serine/threonine protein kinase [Sandaracinaceae bacterium]